MVRHNSCSRPREYSLSAINMITMKMIWIISFLALQNVSLNFYNFLSINISYNGLREMDHFGILEISHNMDDLVWYWMVFQNMGLTVLISCGDFLVL